MKECKKQLSRCCRIKNRSSSACLRQISLTGGIPFSVSLPKAPASVDAGRMTTAELRNAIMAGTEILNGIKNNSSGGIIVTIYLCEITKHQGGREVTGYGYQFGGITTY